MCYCFYQVWKSSDVTAKQTLVIRTSKMNRPRELFVSGLPYHLSNEKLSSYFASFGPISKFTRPPDRRTGRNGSFAFLSYRDISIFECKSARFLCKGFVEKCRILCCWAIVQLVDYIVLKSFVFRLDLWAYFVTFVIKILGFLLLTDTWYSKFARAKVYELWF